MEKIHPPKVYWTICAWLMALLALTWGLGYVNLGLFNLPLALAIASAKTILVVLFFMHIKGSSRLFHLVAITGLLWFSLLLILTLADYISRGAVSMPR